MPLLTNHGDSTVDTALKPNAGKTVAALDQMEISPSRVRTWHTKSSRPPLAPTRDISRAHYIAMGSALLMKKSIFSNRGSYMCDQPGRVCRIVMNTRSIRPAVRKEFTLVMLLMSCDIGRLWLRVAIATQGSGPVPSLTAIIFPRIERSEDVPYRLDRITNPT